MILPDRYYVSQVLNKKRKENLSLKFNPNVYLSSSLKRDFGNFTGFFFVISPFLFDIDRVIQNKYETSLFYKNRQKTRVLTQKKPWKKVKLGKKVKYFHETGSVSKTSENNFDFGFRPYNRLHLKSGVYFLVMIFRYVQKIGKGLTNHDQFSDTSFTVSVKLWHIKSDFSTSLKITIDERFFMKNHLSF